MGGYIQHTLCQRRKVGYLSGETISSSWRYISIDNVVRGTHLVGITDRGSSSGADNGGRHCSTPCSQPSRYSQGNIYSWLPIDYIKPRHHHLVYQLHCTPLSCVHCIYDHLLNTSVYCIYDHLLNTIL